MELLSKLDEEATKENAKEKLSKYRKYKSYINAPINPKITASFGDGGSSSQLQYQSMRSNE